MTTLLDDIYLPGPNEPVGVLSWGKSPELTEKDLADAVARIGGLRTPIGVRVRHFVFGEGTITSLEQVTGHGENRQFRAAIQFDDSDEKHIHLPMPKDKMEVLGSK